MNKSKSISIILITFSFFGCSNFEAIDPITSSDQYLGTMKADCDKNQKARACRTEDSSALLPDVSISALDPILRRENRNGIWIESRDYEEVVGYDAGGYFQIKNNTNQDIANAGYSMDAFADRASAEAAGANPFNCGGVRSASPIELAAGETLPQDDIHYGMAFSFGGECLNVDVVTIRVCALKDGENTDCAFFDLDLTNPPEIRYMKLPEVSISTKEPRLIRENRNGTWIESRDYEEVVGYDAGLYFQLRNNTHMDLANTGYSLNAFPDRATAEAAGANPFSCGGVRSATAVPIAAKASLPEGDIHYGMAFSFGGDCLGKDSVVIRACALVDGENTHCVFHDLDLTNPPEIRYMKE